MQCGAASQRAETIEDVLQLGAAQELVARGVLAADLLEGPRQDRLFDLLRHHDDPVDIAEDEVAGLHANAGAGDRHVDVGDLTPPFQAGRAEPPLKTEKPALRMARTSRTKPSVTAPTAPRARAAVVSNSPQGAMRSEPPQPKTTISPDLRSSMILISSS